MVSNVEEEHEHATVAKGGVVAFFVSNCTPSNTLMNKC